MSYLNPPSGGFAGSIHRIQGYRPIEITLTFRDGSQALPDSIGPPQVGTAYVVGPEILKLATNEQRINRSTQITQEAQQSGLELAILPVQVFVTSQRPILYSSRGASVRLFWHNPNNNVPSTGDIPISPTNVFVDSQLGLIEITQAPPQNKSSVVAYYYTTLSEKSSRSPESEWTALISNSIAGQNQYYAGAGLSQVYPITRNRTDYLFGKNPKLVPPNLEKSSPDYYPVYEYLVLSDGTIQFSTPLHPFSKQPASISVKYLTLGIEPRLIIDMARDFDVGLSPEIPPVTLAVETINK